MVLVDTSVWIRGLAGQPAYKPELDRLINLEQVAGHDLVYGELLAGDRGGRARLLSRYELMHQARVVRHAEVVAFVRGRNLYGLGLGWTELHLLASALVDRFQLWTADARFAAVAAKFGIAHKAPVR